MVKKVRSPLPIDLLNLLGSFVGDDYHYLTFELTPKGFLSDKRIFMQSRHNHRKKSRNFDNMFWGILRVFYGKIIVRERKKYEQSWHYEKACKNYIKLGIIWL